MLRGLGILTVCALLLAGCVAPPEEIDAASLDDALAPAQRLVSFNAAGVVPLPETVRDLVVRVAHVGHDGPEPSLGVLSDGTIFITAGGAATLARSTDHGASWDLVTTGTLVTAPKVSLDPWMWVDPETDRIYNAPLYVACTWATWSDDGGDTWDEFNPTAGCVQGLPAHDHQKLTSGPPAEGVSTDGYPSVIYYSYNSFREEGTWIQQSFDGGKTFNLGQAVHPSSCHSGIAGPVAVGPDGTAYSPKPTCKGIEMATSRDSGATWTLASVEDAGSANALAHMTDAAVDDANNAYATWNGEDGDAYITRTTDHGETWSKAIRVSPPDVTVTAHNVITAGAEGRVAVAYLGTRADSSKWKDQHAEAADEKAVWHLFLSITEDALAADPVWTTVQVTPDDDPVQIGQIWLSGGGEASRNLLDFIDMVHRDGRLYIGYADGCDACDKADDSRGSEAVVALVATGPSLLGGLLPPLGEALTEPREPAEGGLLGSLPRPSLR